MVRLDALLDARRGTLLRAAIEVQVAGWLRARQYDNREPLPQDVATIEQMRAQALTRLAELHLTASDKQRAAGFTPTPLYYLPATNPERNPVTPAPVPDLPEVPDGCALTVYGDLVPADALPSMRDPAARVLTVDPETGQPAAIDGRPVDADPASRLATPDQRVALGFRDRHCTEPGCTRPITWEPLRFNSFLSSGWLVECAWTLRKMLKISCVQSLQRSVPTSTKDNGVFWPARMRGRWAARGSPRWPGRSRCRRRQSRGVRMSLPQSSCRLDGCGRLGVRCSPPSTPIFRIRTALITIS